MMIERLKRGKQIGEKENEALVVKIAGLIEINVNLTATNVALHAHIGAGKT